MKRLLIIFFVFVFVILMYKYYKDAQTYWDTNYIEQDKYLAKEEYIRYQSYNFVKDNNNTKIELHVDYSDIEDIKTKDIAIYIDKYTNKDMVINEQRSGLYYNGIVKENILIARENEIRLYILMIDNQNKKVYTIHGKREAEWGNEFLKYKEAYIKLRRDGKYDIKFNKHTPYFWVPWINKNDSFPRYILALTLSIFH